MAKPASIKIRLNSSADTGYFWFFTAANIEAFVKMVPFCTGGSGNVAAILHPDAKMKIMLAGHMDEIGFMVKQITKEGFIKFIPLGGWFDQVLLGQRVVIKTNKGDVIGVIGAKPPHLLSAEDRQKVVTRKDMYIDIGATEEAGVREAGVQLGDPIIPLAGFQILADKKTYLSKAFDDRVGIAMMIQGLQALKDQPHPNTIFAAAGVGDDERSTPRAGRAPAPHGNWLLENGQRGKFRGEAYFTPRPCLPSAR